MKNFFFFLFVSIAIIGMEKPPKTPAKSAVPGICKQVASLLNLAIHACVNLFNKSNTLARYALQAKLLTLPRELQERAKPVLITENRALLEEIIDAKPIRICDKEMHPRSEFKVSPNSEYLCYIAQKRLPNNKRQWPLDTLVLIHLATGTCNYIGHPNLSVKIDGAHELGHFSFTPDSKEIFFHDAPDKATMYQYNIFRKKIYAKETFPGSLDNFVIGQDQQSQVHFYNSTPFPAVVDPIHQNYLTHLIDSIQVHNANRMLFTKPHRIQNTNPDGRTWAQFSPSGSLVATVSHNTIRLWNVQTEKLFNTIAYRYLIEHIAFNDENTLLVELLKEDTRRFDMMRTDIPTRTTSLLVPDILSPNPTGKLSTDTSLYVGSQVSKGATKKRLFDCYKQQCIKEYPKSPDWEDHAFAMNDSAIVVKGRVDRKRVYPYLYYTHRSLIKDTSLEELLTLLQAECHKQLRQPINHELLAILSKSRNSRLSEIAQQRYGYKPSAPIASSKQ